MVEPYKIVSFFTDDYAHYADGLRRSIEQHLPGVPFEIERISPCKWATATCHKPRFMLEKLGAAVPGMGILWIDADALVMGSLDLPSVDFAVYARLSHRLRFAWSPIRSGTVLIRATDAGRALAHEWMKQARNRTDGNDQWALWTAWLTQMREGALMPSTAFLPLEYCRKHDEAGPVRIRHLMASRKLKHSK